MITNTREKIVAYITKNHQVRVHDLSRYLGVSPQALHRQLKKLVQEGTIQKVGKPPVVFYILAPQADKETEDLVAKLQVELSAKSIQALTENFLSITPDGKILTGLKGFVYWVQVYQKNSSIKDLVAKYEDILTQKKKYTTARGWIDATNKLRETFDTQYIDHLFFADIYSYPLFGRTKLAKLVMYAKQLEHKDMIDEISRLVKSTIEHIVKTYDIDSVGYIPPTIPRTLQFMDELATQLHLPLPQLDLVKVLAGDIPVPQKTLTKLSERQINAARTIYMKDNKTPSYNRVLLIDDVAGSGSSFHETARKLKAADIGSETIITFAVVGNIKGYDVVREV